MRRVWPLLLVLPFIVGFDGPEAREALDLAFHNLYAPDILAGVELRVEDGATKSGVEFAYGRKVKGRETRTLLYQTPPSRSVPRALLFQRPGQQDRIFVSEGQRGTVRPLAAGRRGWPLFGSDFTYEDFRAHSADEYRIEVLGPDRIDGEPCRVLRLRPLYGPYSVMLTWLSTRRPVIVRTDYFDDKGLWKRYRARVDELANHLDWWVPMRDEMLDLRTGRRTERIVRNILIDTEVPDGIFTTTPRARGRLPSF
jgi:hypothetical protein